ncbi:MAG: hypothetical protein AAFP70_05685 [Calditrichota bacterium]
MQILNTFLAAKKVDITSSEDLIHTSQHFIAVIDGATSQSGMTWSGMSGGQFVASVIDEVLTDLPPNSTANSSITIITERVKTAFLDIGIDQAIAEGKTEPPAAVLCVINKTRGEIWMVGDCQYRLDDDVYAPGKKIDIILAEARALYLEAELKQGKTIQDLLRNDTGREFISPMLKRQSTFLNNLRSDYGYPAISNSPVPEHLIHVRKIPKAAKKLILTTDGYPSLKSSFEESEAYLANLLKKDPLLFRDYKSTKGLVAGNISFDDRAWVEIKL